MRFILEKGSAGLHGSLTFPGRNDVNVVGLFLPQEDLHFQASAIVCAAVYGESFYKPCVDAFLETNAAIDSRLTEEERSQFIATLKKLI